MKLRSSIGYCVLSVLFTTFSGTSSSDSPSDGSPIIDKHIHGNSRKPRWADEIFGNLMSSISNEVNSLRQEARAIWNEDVVPMAKSIDEKLREYWDGDVDKLAPDHVLFQLYTKSNLHQPQPLKPDDSPESLLNSHFDKDKSTVFVTHGWLNTATFAACTSIRDAYLASEEGVNVIIVDWSALSVAPYHWSVRRVEMIGKEIARMIESLRIHAKLDLRTTTLVGHSLGAHIMGVAGRESKGAVNQIFGLDPARPLFEIATNPDRLSKKSARNVQVIHTNANGLGLAEPLGHADFYPNGGSEQPGCRTLDLFSNGVCSHARSIYLLAESINSKVAFQGIKCEDGENVSKCSGRVATMGGRSNNINEVGVFYLKTRNASPFARKLQSWIQEN